MTNHVKTIRDDVVTPASLLAIDSKLARIEHRAGAASIAHADVRVSPGHLSAWTVAPSGTAIDPASAHGTALDPPDTELGIFSFSPRRYGRAAPHRVLTKPRITKR